MNIIEIISENADQTYRIIEESWKTAYRDIVPRDYLNGLRFIFESPEETV